MRIMDRGYIADPSGYAIFLANAREREAGRSVLTTERLQVANTFPNPFPSMSLADGAPLLTWLADDTTRTPVNRTELRFSVYDAITDTWSSPLPISDDLTADFHPDVATLPDGDVVAAWQNVDTVLDEPDDPTDPQQVEAKLEEFKDASEITVSRFDPATSSWSAQESLTDNSLFDHSPRLSSASDGTAMLAWIRNDDGSVSGSVASPNEVWYSIHDGATWTPPMNAANNIPSILKSDMAYNGTSAHFIYSAETDDDTSTPEDREIFVITWDGVKWSPPVRLTNNSVEDASPQIIWREDDMSWLVMWYQDGDMLFSTMPETLADQSVAVDRTGASTSASDFRFVTGPTGNIAVVWQSASLEQVDLKYSVFDPVQETWTMPQGLTADNSMEQMVTGTFDSQGDLLLGYAKVETLSEVREVQVGDEMMEVEVPVPGLVDLYTLRHTVGGSLLVGGEGLTVSPPNPLPGQPVELSLPVLNGGDTAASGVEVAFYDGDPSGDGSEIGRVTLEDTLIGGEQGLASLDWIAPASNEPFELWAQIDPDNTQEDIDLTDNASTLPGFMLPDLTVDSLSAPSAGADNVLLRARIGNTSGVPVSDFDVEFRRDTPDGAILATVQVPEQINPGTSRDVTWLWENAVPYEGGSQLV